MKRLVLATMIVLATLAGLVLLWQLRLALVLFALSLAVAAAARPANDVLIARGIPRGLAITLVYVFSLVILGGPVILAGPSFLRELQQSTDQLASSYEQITSVWPNGAPFQRAVASQLPPPNDLYKAISGERGSLLLQNMFGAAQDLATLVGQLFIVLVLSIYWSADRVRFERLWLSLLSPPNRARAHLIWRSVEEGVGAYIRSALVQSLLAGFLLGSAYALIGLPYPVLLASLGALSWLIPWLGAFLALIPPALVGFQISALHGIGAALLTLAILLGLEVFVEPRLFNRKQFSSLLAIILVVVMADAFGLVGVVIAPPLAAAIQILGYHLARAAVENSVPSSAEFSRLQERLEAVRELAAVKQEPRAPELDNLLERLGHLMELSQEALQSAEVPEGLSDLAPVETGLKEQ